MRPATLPKSEKKIFEDIKWTATVPPPPKPIYINLPPSPPPISSSIGGDL